MTARTESLRPGDTVTQPDQDAPLRLRGGWLVLGRVLYVGLLLLCLALFALSLWIIFGNGVASCDSPPNAEWTYCDEFRQAQAQLEAYRNLIVRVAGYSDYFVLLGPDIQEEILARTEHGI